MALCRILSSREGIAHGSAKDGLTEGDYTSLERAVALVVDDVVKAISDAVTKQLYLIAA